MSEVIIVHEVVQQSLKKGKWVAAGTFYEWMKSSPMFLGVTLRQFGYGTKSALGRCEVLLPKLQVDGDDAFTFLIRQKGSFTLLCRIENQVAAGAEVLDNARRPGAKDNSNLARRLGVEFQTELNLYSVAIAESSDLLNQAGARDGWLVQDPSRKSGIARTSQNVLLALSIAAERAILNRATIAISELRPYLIFGRRELKKIRRCPTLPPIDSTSLANDYMTLRASLHLEQRRSDCLKFLELQERNYGYLLSALAVAGSLVALSLDLV